MGKLVLQDMLAAEQTPIQVSQLTPVSYSLTLNNETKKLKTFILTTNGYGLVNLEIGNGTVISGDFTTIN
jgi:hypothetical protein